MHLAPRKVGDNVPVDRTSVASASGGAQAGSSAEIRPDALCRTLDPRAATLLNLVRSGEASTRPQLEQVTGLGRKVVAQRVAELLETGLVHEGPLGPSTGGRAPRQLRFVAEAGLILVAHCGATGMGLGVTDLAGTVLAQDFRSNEISDGPSAALGLALEVWDELMTSLVERLPAGRRRVWGVGIAVPGPVEFSTGRPVAPPIMPGWDAFPIRETIQAKWRVPVWVDNDVNAMVLGEVRAGIARGSANTIFVKIGTGIGAGIIAGGALVRGQKGVAGDVGHIPVREHLGVTCRCGRVDCLEAVAAARTLIGQAMVAANSGVSPVLATLLKRTGRLEIRDLAEAASRGDHATTELLRTSGRRVGEMLATLVNMLNPGLLVLGGQVADVGDLYLAAVRQAIYERSLPVATRDLTIVRSPDSYLAGLAGSAFTAIDELFAQAPLERWIGSGEPRLGEYFPEQLSA